MSDVRFLFALAAAHKAAGEMEKVDEDFLATVVDGIPNDVRVVYLFGNRDELPVSLDVALYYDIFVLEMEGEEGQTMPVPLLQTLDPQLAQSLFAAAEFRQLEEEDEDDDDWDGEDDVSWGGDEPPRGGVDIVDWGCDDPCGDLLDDDWDDDD